MKRDEAAADRSALDLARVRRAIQHVLDAARAESSRLAKAAEECDDDSMASLGDAHREELDAIQALTASLELFERRLQLPLQLPVPPVK